MSFPRYPSYKDSGVEWLGEVPGHWVVAKTVRYFKVAMGQTILRENLIDDGEWPVFSATDGDHYFGRVNEPQVRLAVGDIVIPARGNSIGAVKLVKEPSTTTQTTIYCKNITSGKLDPSFVFHFLKGCKDNLFYFTQTAIPQITVDEVGSNPILIPPLPEQTQIAAFLERETAKIDELVAEQRRLMELLKEKRQAVISHAVTKGLNPDTPMKPSGIGWLGDVPAHWEVMSLRRCASSIQTGGTPSTELPSTDLEEVLVWFTPGDFSDSLFLTNSTRKISSEVVASGEAKAFPPRSVLIVSIGATLGKVGFAEQASSANQQINAVIPNERVDGYFLAYSLLVKAEVMRFLSNASTIGIMNQEKTKDIWLAVPPTDEQINITAFLDTETAKLDTLTAESQRAIDLLQERRTALISAAVTGQIDVT